MKPLKKIARDEPILRDYVRKVKSEITKLATSLTDIGAGPTVFTLKPQIAKRIEYLLTKYGLEPYSAMARVKGKDRFTIICDAQNINAIGVDRVANLKAGVQQILSRMGYKGITVKVEKMGTAGEVAIVLAH